MKPSPAAPNDTMAPPEDQGTASMLSFAFPMYVLPISAVLRFDEIPPHEDVKEQLVEYQAGMGACAFMSHTWLRWRSPDSAIGEKLSLLKALINRWAAGKHDVETDEQLLMWCNTSMRVKAAELKQIKYIWFDYFSIPQTDTAEARENQAKAIASIAAYITTSSFFFCLGGPWRHEDGSSRDLRAWTKRGWCRLECLANALSPSEKRLVVVESVSNMRACSSSGLFWAPLINQTVGTGAFTVAADAFRLGPIIRALLASKKCHALASNDLLSFRQLHALADRMLEGTVEEREAPETMDAWMASMRFTSPRDGERSGWSPLRFAMMAGREDIMRSLLQSRASVESRVRKNEPRFFMQKGSSVLGDACKMRAPLGVVKLLLEYGAKPDLIDGPGFSPSPVLGAAYAGGSVELFDYLAERFPEQWNVYYAKFEHSFLGGGYFGQEHMIRHALRTYPDQMSQLLNAPDPIGFTLLKFAALPYGAVDPGCIRAYLEGGEDPNCTAPLRGHPSLSIMFAFIRAIFWARGLPKSKILEFMATLGPGCNATALHMAAYYGKLGAIDVLLDFGADVNSTSGVRGLTPLHAAAMRGHEAVAQRLLAAGADPTIRDRYRRRPFDWATKRGYTELARTLSGAGGAWGGAPGGQLHAKVAAGPTHLLKVAPKVAPKAAPSKAVPGR